MIKLFFSIMLLFTLPARSQEVIDIDGAGCPMNGSSKPGSNNARLNEYKNRYNFPHKEDFDTTISLQNLAESADPNQFSPDKAVIVRGYIFNVKAGGIETCNCKTKDAQFRDTHIELTVKENALGPEARVIAEVSPRFRAIMQRRGVDWTTPALRRALKGTRVTIAGWLMYDAEHELEAYANDPDNVVGRRNWRATCWEVHPITYLQITNGAEPTCAQVIAQQDSDKNPDEKKHPQSGSSNTTMIVIIVLFCLAVVVWLLLKNKGVKSK